MFENIGKFFKKFGKNEKIDSKNTAKERLHLVLAQDRANISADFLEMMKQEIIEVIKKYIDIDEEAIDVRMTNKQGDDGTLGAPSLYANIPIVTIKNEARKLEGKLNKVKEEKEIKKKNVQNVETADIKESEYVDKPEVREKEEIEHIKTERKIKKQLKPNENHKKQENKMVNEKSQIPNNKKGNVAQNKKNGVKTKKKPQKNKRG